MKLSRDKIVMEAVALMQEEGLEAVSLRRVATRLDAKAPSLARHVGDKQSLLALMSSHIFRSVLAEVEPVADWRVWALAFGRALWRKQQQTRDIAQLIIAVPPLQEAMEQTLSALRAQIDHIGLPLERAMILQSAVQALVTGWTGFSTGAQGTLIAAMLPVDEAVEESLSALIAGFEPAMRG